MFFPNWNVNFDLSGFYQMLYNFYTVIPKQVFSFLGILGMFALFSSFRNKFAGGDES